MKKHLSVFAALALSTTSIAILVAGAGAAAAPLPTAQRAADDGPDLFLPVESWRTARIAPSAGERPEPPSRGVTTVRSRYVRVAPDRLSRAIETLWSGQSAALTLNFFEDAAFSVVLDETLQTWTAGGYTLLGRLAGFQGAERGDVSLVVRGGTVSGTVWTSGATFEIETIEGGVHVVREVDLSMLPEPEGDALPYGNVVPAAADDRLSSASGPHVIDVMVLFTPRARAHFHEEVSSAIYQRAIIVPAPKSGPHTGIF